MGQLRAAPDGRVITMSSGGMYSQRLDVTALDPHPEDYDGVKAYARAKRAQVELTRLWDLHYGGSGLRFVAMHPGWVATDRSRLGTSPLRAPCEASAADTRTGSGHCRVARVPRRAPALSDGRFWLDRRRRREHLVPWTHSPSAEPDRLWEWCVANAGLQA